MKNSKKIRIAIALLILSSFSCSCQKADIVSQVEEPRPTEEATTQPTTEEVVDNITGQTITWLGDYELSSASGERPVALALFQDVYNADINFIHTTAEKKFERLDECFIYGEEVDMFPFDISDYPSGILRNRYQPLDPYFDIMGINDDSGLWDDMLDTINMLEYKGEHFVIPFSVSNPDVIIYSRKLMEQENLEDPYELYKKGEWNWDVMLEMMDKFVKNSDGSVKRYGINGSIGQAAMISSGGTIVKYDNGAFVNNMKSKEIESAGKFLQRLSEGNLIDRNYIGHFPKDNSTLFFSMGAWAIGESNALNSEDSDLMAVPFPKSPTADKYYMNCDINARMLIYYSTKGEAVAAYIKCERIAATQKEYREIEKKKALIVNETPTGQKKPFITEEQYDVIQSYIAENTPVFDFAYGMGESMFNNNERTYAEKGAVNNITDAIPDGVYSSWKGVCEDWEKVVDDALKDFNK